MKGAIIALVGVGGAAIIYALSRSAKAQVKARTSSTDGVAGSYYDPTAHIWSEEQPSNNGRAIPANPILGELPTGPSAGLTYPDCRINGPCSPSGSALPSNPPAGGDTIGTLPIGSAPATGLSSTFWAADKVPQNPALQMPYQEFDANPTLGDNLGTYLLPPGTTIPPVNQV